MAAMNFPNGPSLGDKYPVTPIVGQPQYTWDGEKWTTVGSQISNATPSAAVPLMDATPGLPGSAAAYSRGDHVHPTDTSRAAKTYVDSEMVSYNTVQTTTSAQRSRARANVDVTKKNYIINGAMMISQENGGNIGTTSPYYPVDMFYAEWSNSGAVQALQVTGAGGVTGNGGQRIRLGVATADAAVAATDYVVIVTKIEGQRMADLLGGLASAKTFTFSFGVKAPAGTYTVAFQTATRTYLAEYVITAGEANIDAYKTITVPGDTIGTAWATNNTYGLWISFTLMSGSNFQGATGSWGTVGNKFASANQFNWMGTVNNFFDLFDVSLTEGSVAPPFQLPDFASELALCQRYWCKSFDYNIVPLNSCPIVRYASFAESTTVIDTQRLYYPVVMRNTPTMVFYSPAAQGAASVNGQWQIYGVGAGSFPSATGTAAITPTSTSFVVNLTGFSALTNAYSYLAYGGWVANARL